MVAEHMGRFFFVFLLLGTPVTNILLQFAHPELLDLAPKPRPPPSVWSWHACNWAPEQRMRSALDRHPRVDRIAGGRVSEDLETFSIMVSGDLRIWLVVSSQV